MGQAPPPEAPAAGSEAGQRLLLYRNYTPLPGLQRCLATAALFKPHAQTDLDSKAGQSAGKGGEAQSPPSDPRRPMTLPSPPRSLCAAGGPSQEDDQGLHVCRKGPHPALPWQWGPALAVRMQLLIGGPHAPQHVAQVLGHHPRQVKHHHGRLQERQA